MQKSNDEYRICHAYRLPRTALKAGRKMSSRMKWQLFIGIICEYNILLKLPALDEGDAVQYAVALIICGIISDNSWKTAGSLRDSSFASKFPERQKLMAQ